MIFQCVVYSWHEMILELLLYVKDIFKNVARDLEPTIFIKSATFL